MAVTGPGRKGRPKKRKSGNPSSKCFGGGGKTCRPGKVKRKRAVKGALTKVQQAVQKFKGKKITLEQANKNVKSANRARLKRKQEEEKKKPIPKLPTKKPKTIPVNTGKKKIIKKKPTPRPKPAPKPKPATTNKKKTATAGTLKATKTVTKMRKPTATIKIKRTIKTVPVWSGKGDPASFAKKHYGSVTTANLKKVMSAYNKKKNQNKKCGPSGCKT